MGEVGPAEIAAAVGTYRSDDGAVITVVEEDVGIRLVSEDGHALDDLFSLPDQIPDIAPVEEVVRFTQSPSVARQLAESGEQTGWPAADPEPGLWSASSRSGSHPSTATNRRRFCVPASNRVAPDRVGLRCQRGMVVRRPRRGAPGSASRPDQEGGFVSFTLRDMPIADHVTVRDGVMRIRIDGRSTAYRRSA